MKDLLEMVNNILEALLDVLMAIGKPIADNAETLLYICQLGLPILMFNYDVTLSEYVPTYLLCIFLFTFGQRFVERTKGITTDLPIPPRQFTVQTELGVEIKDCDIEEALIYLNSLEAYMRRKGVLK